MPAIGEPAPDFELQNQAGKKIKLSDYRGKKVVIFAFPKANTPGCNQQACSFRDAWPQIEAKDAVVLGVSADSVDELAAWKTLKKLPYDLLSDPDHKMLMAWAPGGLICGFSSCQGRRLARAGWLMSRGFWSSSKSAFVRAKALKRRWPPSKAAESGLFQAASVGYDGRAF